MATSVAKESDCDSTIELYPNCTYRVRALVGTQSEKPIIVRENLKTGVIIRMTLGDKKETKKIRENKESI